MELSKRKNIRLKNYDYSQNNLYYITICTQNRNRILWSVGVGIIDDPHKKLSPFGVICDNVINDIHNHIQNIVIDKYVIMPDHIHLIIIVNNENRVVKDADPYNAVLPKFISSLKRFTNKQCGEKLWQRNYYEHIIRDEKDYQKIWQYIGENPQNNYLPFIFDN